MNLNTHADITHVRASRRDPSCYFDTIELHVAQETRRNGISKFAYATAVNFAEVEEGMMPPHSPVRLFADEAQVLMDSLWSCGIRPSEGTGSAGSLAATERHLADMRAIVANSLGVALK